jgi:serine/threonine-protein kinase
VTGPTRLGNYLLFEEIAAGGMATVHLGRDLRTERGGHVVAIKRLHESSAHDVELRAMLMDEARLSFRVVHPNVVSTLDVVYHEGEFALVMEYVQGESLARLLAEARARGERIPVEIAVGILVGVLRGLYAAHVACDDDGQPLMLVHRDVSPQNVMVGTDGVARLADFGVAKAVGRLQTTRDGRIKGKCSYMAPEQLRGAPLDARTDVYAAAVVLWEALTGRRLFDANEPELVLLQILERPIPPPSSVAPDVPRSMDEIVLRGLARDPNRRHGSAEQMALALESAVPRATQAQIGAWVAHLAGPRLDARAARVAEIRNAALDDALAPVAATQARPSPQRRGIAALVVIVSLLAASAFALTLVRGAKRLPPAAGVAPESAPAASGSASAPVERATEPSSAPPSASASTPHDVAATTRVSAPTRGRPSRASSAPAPSTAKPDCNPPYRVDASGIRIMKRECM